MRTPAWLMFSKMYHSVIQQLCKLCWNNTLYSNKLVSNKQFPVAHNSILFVGTPFFSKYQLQRVRNSIRAIFSIFIQSNAAQFSCKTTIIM